MWAWKTGQPVHMTHTPFDYKMTNLKAESSMCRLPSATPLWDMGVVSTDGFVLEYFQLHVEPLQLRADVIRIHVRQGDFTHVRVAIVASKWAVCVYILLKKHWIISTVMFLGRVSHRFGWVKWCNARKTWQRTSYNGLLRLNWEIL